MINYQRLKNKMRLIGYYNTPNQTMHAETEYVEEATFLAERLKTSFNSLRNNTATDDIFRSILNSNAVFILKDEEQNLYAYFPCKDIARISNVVYNKRSVVPIPLKYKSWFIPGENIVIENKESEYPQRYTITTSGSDFLITDYKQHKTLALDWDEDTYISIKELSKFINDKWILLYEYETEENCGDCDGYDYSNCDMSRCKNDCETCGGRRYICNNSCFNHRHNKALRYDINEKVITNELSELLDILSIVANPQSEQQLLFNQYYSSLEKAYNHCKSLSKYIDISETILESFVYKMDLCSLINDGRINSKDIANVMLIYIDGEKAYCINKKSIGCVTKGFLLWKTCYMRSYYIHNYLTNSLVNIDYKLAFNDEDSKKTFINKIREFSIIHLESIGEDYFEVKRFY